VSRASGDTQQQVVRSIIVFPVCEANPKMVLLVMVLPGLCSGFSGFVEEWQNHFLAESFFSSNVTGHPASLAS
jgi:hypothetical protein